MATIEDWQDMDRLADELPDPDRDEDCVNDKDVCGHGVSFSEDCDACELEPDDDI